MPRIEVREEQVLELLEQLSPRARREAVRRLLPSAVYLERALEWNRGRIEALARKHGLDWNVLSEDQREKLIDQILHE